MVRTKAKKKSSMARRRTKSVSSSLNQSSVISGSSASSLNGDEDLSHLISKQYDSPQEFLKEFESYYDKKIEIRRQAYEKACALVEQMIDDKLNSLPSAFRKMNINSEVSEAILAEIGCLSEERTPPSARQPRARKVADSFEFKKPKTPRVGRSPVRKRSLSASAASCDRNKTPMMTCRKMPPGHTITPKIYNDFPITVMRRPAYGEVAVSLTGSPLMVGAIAQEELPTVNVPFMDGRVLSIMPEEGGAPPDMPEIDEKTRQYLKTLKRHLEILAPSSP